MCVCLFLSINLAIWKFSVYMGSAENLLFGFVCVNGRDFESCCILYTLEGNID